MKIYFILVLVTIFFASPARADKQVVPTEPCDVSISLLDPVPREKISFWGKVLEVMKVDDPPRGQEIVFEPKTTRAGPKLKRVKVFMKRSHCWLEVKKDQHWSVALDEKGKGTIFAVRFETQEEIKKSKKYPVFEPEMTSCQGFNARLGFTSADLYVLAKSVKVSKDEKEKIRIITFQAKRIWNGPQVEQFKVLQKIGYCDSPLYPGGTYDLVLNSADKQFYYHDCCGVTGAVGDDYESRAIEWNKKYFPGNNKKDQ